MTEGPAAAPTSDRVQGNQEHDATGHFESSLHLYFLEEVGPGRKRELVVAANVQFPVLDGILALQRLRGNERIVVLQFARADEAVDRRVGNDPEFLRHGAD